MNKKYNGYAKWIIIIIAIGTILYNTIATHVVARNEIKHLTQAVQNNSKRIDNLTDIVIQIIKEK